MYNKEQFIRAARTIATAMREPFGGSTKPLAEAIPMEPHQDYARIASFGILEDLLCLSQDMRIALHNLPMKEREDLVERMSNIIRVANNVSRTAMLVVVEETYYEIHPAHVVVFERSADLVLKLDPKEFVQRFGYSKKIAGTPDIGDFVVDPGLIKYMQEEIDSFTPQKL
jgi:hypothetical protein